MLRPCVARIMSLSRGWNTISWIGTVGSPERTRCHLPPLSSETNRPNSVPTYNTDGFFGILGHRRHGVAGRQALVDRAEVVAAVDARIDVALVVVVLVVVERRVDGAGVVLRRHQAGHIRVLRHVREPRREVGPRLAAVPRHVHHAIVRSGQDQSRLLRRLDDLHEVAVRAHAVVARDRDAFAGHAHQRQRRRDSRRCVRSPLIAVQLWPRSVDRNSFSAPA